MHDLMPGLEAGPGCLISFTCKVEVSGLMALRRKPVDPMLSRKWLRKFSALASSLLPDLTFSYANFLASFLIDQYCRTKVVPSAYSLVSISVSLTLSLVTPYYAVDNFILWEKKKTSKPWSGQLA